MDGQCRGRLGAVAYTYLETSAVNRLLDRLVRPNELGPCLGQTSPAIGVHVIYEVCRCFLDEQNTDRGRRLAGYLYELEPTVLKPVDQLLQDEITSLRTGSEVVTFLDTFNQVASIQEIYRLSEGSIEQARSFVSAREQYWNRQTPVDNGAYLEHVASARQQDPSLSLQLATFEGMLDYAYTEGQIRDLIASVLFRHGIRIDHLERRELEARLDSVRKSPKIQENLYLLYRRLRP